MKYSRLWLAASIIAFVVVVGFVLSVPHTRDVGKTEQSQSNAASAPVVSLRDLFKKGVHTITGTMEVPNACTAVTVLAALSGDTANPDGILVQISYPADIGVCLQVPTSVSFSTTISAPAGLPLTATVNGVAATTTAS